MRKGFILSMDAVFAASIITVIVMFMLSLSMSYSSPELTYKRIYSTGKDAIIILENAKISSVYDMLDADLINDCSLTEEDFNRTLLDMIGYYWAQGDLTCAENLTRFLYDEIMYDTPLGFSLLIDENEIYTTSQTNPDYISRISTVVSGYEKEKVARGFLSKVFMTKASKISKTYEYFGGYVGDGNITKTFTLPDNVNVTEFYIEADVGNNFSLRINDAFAGSYYPEYDNMSADNFMVCDTAQNYSLCNNITGGNNTIQIIFTTSSGNYIGGGYFRIRYKTDEILETQIQTGTTYTKKQYLPGIKGIINLYSSFYIPGNVTNMSAFLHYKNNLTINGEGIAVYFNVGGDEIYRSNNTGVFNATINDSTISGILNYTNISGMTVPFRFGTESFLSTFGIGRSDSVLITDRSGSMDNCDVDTTSCSYSDCDGDPGCQNTRIDVAKDSDKSFVDVMLNVTGNRVGLNGYGASGCSSFSMTNNTSSLEGQIIKYDHDCGCTCISCGLIKAIETIVTESVSINMIPRQSEWLYNTSYPDSEPMNDTNNASWIDISYNDSSWKSGFAILGFEDSPYSPNIDTNIGNNNGNYYFRKHFNVSDTSDIGTAELFVLADNSAQIYLNGHLIFNDTSSHQAEYWNRGGVIFSDGFESDLNKWDIDTNNDGGVVAIDDEPHSGSHNVEFYGDGSSPNEMWIQKTLNISDRNNITLRYFWSTEDLESSDHGRLDIYDGTWNTDVKNYGLNNGRTSRHDYSTDPLEYVWEDVDVNDFNYINNFTVRFRSTAVHAERYDTFLIDDIEVREHLYVNKSLLLPGDNVIAVKLRNNDSDSAKFDMKLNYTQSRHKAIAVMSDGGANTLVNGESCEYSSGSENPAKDEVVDLACEARDRYGVTIYSIAFGDGAYPTTLRKAACWNCTTNDWIEGEGEDNCSKFYQSSNAEELEAIYSNIASDIANATYKAQTIEVSGDISLDNAVYPDSYIEFQYTPKQKPISYGEITLKYESLSIGDLTGPAQVTDNETGTKEGWFSIPPNSTIIEAMATSYSSNYWTDRLWVNSSNTPNENWTKVYWLGNFSDDYEILGDPYIVNIPVEYLTSGGNNSFRIGTGLLPENGSGASPDDRMIYTISIGGIGLVGYSGVFPKLEGSTVTIWSDLDGDNNADTSFNVSIGPNPDDIFDPMNDSIDDAFMRLLDNLNIIYDSNPGSYGDGSVIDPYDGVNETNPIEIEITSDIDFNSNYISDVPSLWGPAILEVRTWI